MEFIDKVEKLRAKTNISYAEAKEILTQTDGDLLAAMILLEEQGRIAPPSEPASPKEEPADARRQSDRKSTGGSDAWKGFWRWVKGLLIKSGRNNLQIKRGDNILAAIPLTVFIVALLCAFWVTVPLLILGLFCGCSYSFRGPDLEKEDINKAWDKASQMAESIKDSIKKEMDAGQDPPAGGEQDK